MAEHSCCPPRRLHPIDGIGGKVDLTSFGVEEHEDGHAACDISGTFVRSNEIETTANATLNEGTETSSPSPAENCVATYSVVSTTLVPTTTTNEEVSSGQEVCVEEASCTVPERIFGDAVPQGPTLKEWIPDEKYPHSCRTCYSECIKKLMSLCDPPEAIGFGQALKPSFQGTKLKKTSETVDSETYIVTTPHKGHTHADPVLQLYSIDTNSASRIYYNLVACKKLSDLHDGGKNKCYGFRIVRSLALVQDALPENFSKAYDEFSASHPRSYHAHPDVRPKDQRYIVMESDYSGTPVLHCRIKPSQAISIIGQVACTLAVAERELEFEHRNLNEENIMLIPSSSKNQHFIIDGRTCCVKGSGIKVTLLDDSFSRMSYNDQIILRMRNYNCVYKEKTAIYLTMERIIKDRWHVFHPETNALWLAYLCGHLSDYLTVPNPTGEWQRKLELLALMQRDLQRFRSADEFVWHYITKIGHVHSGADYHPHHWGEEDRSTGSSIYTTLMNFLHWRSRGHKSKGSTPSPAGPSPRPGPSRGGDASPAGGHA
ncbi:uncharacterized protein LOC144146937 isoform X4 [Haemaphysalis longicornis]